jgi:nitronate monooxygenase
MLVESSLDDVLLSRAVTGLPTNLLKASLRAAGLDPDDLPERGPIDILQDINPEARRWKDVWSAGHTVSLVDDAPPAAALVERLAREYAAARG